MGSPTLTAKRQIFRPKPWDRLKTTLSKDLFDDSITEVRTLQNDVIGTITQIGHRRFQVTNYKNDKVLLPTFKDSKIFILKTYFFAGKPLSLERNLQLNLF